MPPWPSWRSKKEKRNGKKAGGTTLAATEDGERSNSLAPQTGMLRLLLSQFTQTFSTIMNAHQRDSIVAVHGLGGDWDGTWTGEANKNWLRDFLPQQLQHERIAARIFSFGYDSRTAFAKAVMDIEDVADMLLNRIEGIRDTDEEQSRPLIFVAHSLGGIIVKKVWNVDLLTQKTIVDSQVDGRQSFEHMSARSIMGPLLQSTHGIVFMGVPHYGADLARWASLVANILQVSQLGWGTNTKFVEALKRNSPTFADISRQFVERAKPLTIRTFFETERWGNQVIVDKASAVLNLPNEIATGVPQANHSTICKFEQVDSQKYYPVWHAVKKLCQKALSDKCTHEGGPLKEIDEILDRRQKERYKNTKAHDCHRAFKTSDYESLKNINPDRAEGTCEWVFKHPCYRNWYENPYDDLLWISADPGCGKSVLSKSLINRDLSESQAHRVCYFFFKDNENQDSLALALCALIHQLFTDRPGLIQHAIPAWEKAGDRVQREADELWRILLGASRDVKAGRTVYVLDALDECADNDRKRLIAMLADFSRTRSTDPSRGRVKFLVTSRPYEWIQNQFQGTLQSWPSIRLRGEEENDQIRQENDQIRQEIDLVIQEKVEKLASDLKLGASTKEQLKCKLLAMKHRTYLWLYLAIEGVREKYRESLRPHKESITSLPTTVEDAYEKILERGAARNKDIVYKVLRIVVGARRPLTISEMAVALGVETSPSSELKLDIEKIHLETHLPQWCGLFVYINHSRIFLIHQTAKEFLVRESGGVVANSQGWKHCLSTMDVEQSMTHICVRYLSQRNLNLGPSNIHSSPLTTYNSINTDTFWTYSAENWAGHARSIQDEAPMFLVDMITGLYDTAGQRFEHWFPIFWKALRPYGFRPVMNAIRLAALNGHSDILQRFLDTDGSDLDAMDKEGNTALIFGSEYGYAKVVRLLLDKGADINAQGRYFKDSKMYARSEGGHEVVYIDRAKRATVYFRHGLYSNALQAASREGHNQVVQILLDKGADVNAQGGGCGGALQLASREGHNQVVQILLDKGADVNAQGGVLSAMQAASVGGHYQVVRMLLDKGADINAQGGYDSALLAASERGHYQVVRMLLDKGADVNAQGRYYSTPLNAASREGHNQVVQMLLDKGADVNAQGGGCGGALQLASREGHNQVVQMLLDEGADVNAQGRDGSVSRRS
ncbi:MAG: hypothetical protein Q9205_007057 [Flavoplaca limonia]